MTTGMQGDEFVSGSAKQEALLTDLYNACDPNQPAPEPYYADLSEARGSTAMADDVLRRLRLTRPGSYLRYLYSGHIGGGKSSELLHLEAILRDSSRLVGGRRYFPIYLDTDEYLNSDDTGLPDLLLAIAAQIGAELHEHLKITIADSYFSNLLFRVRANLLTELGVEKVEAGGSLPGGLPR